MEKKYFWFSFSNNGKNVGVCLVEKDTIDEARDRVIELGIAPEHDHLQVFGISKAELPLNILFTPEEMVKLGYESVKTRA